MKEFITGFNFELAEVQSVLFDLNKLKQTQCLGLLASRFATKAG